MMGTNVGVETPETDPLRSRYLDTNSHHEEIA